MTPLQRISMKVTMPTIIVTSPGFHVRSWARATIQVRMKGAAQAATNSQSSVEKTCHALAESPFEAPPGSLEFGLSELVVNQGSHSDASRTSAAPIPISSPGDTLEGSR
jgi:hypothetical protein